jgi:hypothetical protein
VFLLDLLDAELVEVIKPEVRRFVTQFQEGVETSLGSARR